MGEMRRGTTMKTGQYCPFCGDEFDIWIEEECGQHPNTKWFMMNHNCTVDISIHEVGGTFEDAVKLLIPRYKDEDED